LIELDMFSARALLFHQRNTQDPVPQYRLTITTVNCEQREAGNYSQSHSGVQKSLDEQLKLTEKGAFTSISVHKTLRDTNHRDKANTT